MCLYSWDFAINHNENEEKKMKNRSHRHNINRYVSRFWLSKSWINLKGYLQGKTVFYSIQYKNLLK